MIPRPEGECPECGYWYERIDSLSEDEKRNFLLADMYDCETCNTVLPAWATVYFGGAHE